MAIALPRSGERSKWAEYRRQRDEEERRQRVMVMTKFDTGEPDATMHTLVDEMLRDEARK